MSCCTGVGLEIEATRKVAGPSTDELLLARRQLGNGLSQTDLSVPDVHCGACIQTIENALSRLDGVDSARVNLSTRRVSVRWSGETVPPMVEELRQLGYPAHLAEAEVAKDNTLSELILAVAISGFATGNIMLLSVSVWSGADGATRDLFHWISALIALPVMAFAGRIFFRSAWNALRHGRMNMDVPIAIGVSLAYAMSLYETITHGDHAYFDASVSLLFFLLIGRTLDHVMRNRARAAVAGLVRLSPRGAVVMREDGGRDFLPIAEIQPGMKLFIAAGDRIPVNARILTGVSDLDSSLATGESQTQSVRPGIEILAGTHNLTGPLVVEALAAASDSFLAEMVRLMEAAEQGRGLYRRIADRASSMYSPVVHLAALLTFIGWVAATGDWHRAMTIAVAVLIITCPCALGLAVPIVQVVAARRLFERGIMVKDGSALERMAEIDTVVFDKTGTLTSGRPVVDYLGTDPAAATLAASLASFSSHPVSRAIHAAFAGPASATVDFTDIAEHPGLGIEARRNGHVYRLGRAAWAAQDADPASAGAGTVLSADGRTIAAFAMTDTLRDGAQQAVTGLRRAGLDIEILSGDRRAAVDRVARALSIDRVEADVLPGGKVARLETLATEGHRALMIGDGLNDAPALAAAHVSMAPASAADIGRAAADFIFLRESLTAAPLAHTVALKADRLIRQNFVLAIGYNVVAVPIAILGHVTPLIAAIAMSTSSLIVIANALRLRAPDMGPEKKPVARVTPAASTGLPVLR